MRLERIAILSFARGLSHLACGEMTLEGCRSTASCGLFHHRSSLPGVKTPASCLFPAGAPGAPACARPAGADRLAIQGRPGLGDAPEHRLPQRRADGRAVPAAAKAWSQRAAVRHQREPAAAPPFLPGPPDDGWPAAHRHRSPASAAAGRDAERAGGTPEVPPRRRMGPAAQPGADRRGALLLSKSHRPGAITDGCRHPGRQPGRG